MKKKLLPYILLGLIVAVIPVTYFLSSRRQDIRQKAAPASSLYFTPASTTSLINQSFNLNADINTGTNLVTGVEMHIKFDGAKVRLNSINLPPTPFLGQIMSRLTLIDNQNGTASAIILSTATQTSNQGTGTIAVLNMTTLATTAAPTVISFEPTTQAAAIGEEATNVIVAYNQGTVNIVTTLPSPTPSPATGCTSTDIVQNGGFETGNFSCWPTVTTAVIVNDSHTPSFGAQLNGVDATVSQNIAQRLTAGVSYTITAWVKINTLGTLWGTPLLHLSKYNDLGTGDFGEAASQNLTTAGWQKLTFTRVFTATDLANPIYIGVRNFGFDGSAVVDDISVVQTAIPTATPPLPVITPTPATNGCITTDKLVSNTTPTQNLTAQITLNIQGTCPVMQQQSLDVMLVIDKSTSMSTRLAATKTAAKQLVDQLSTTYDHIGLVSFSDTANLDQSLTADFTVVKSKIDAINLVGGTNIGQGVLYAQQQLALNGRSQGIPIVILLTDGVSTRTSTNVYCDNHPIAPTLCTQDAITQANLAKQAGTTMFTVGIGLHSPNSLDTQAVLDLAILTLKSMASSANKFYDSPTTTQLNGAYTDIATVLINIITQDAVITDVLPAGITYVVGSAVPPPTSISGQTLVWNIGSVSTSQITDIIFQIKFANTGINQLVETYPDSRIDYTDSNGQPITIPFPETKFTPLQLIPSPTPTPSVTPTPTPTRSPSPTPTPTPTRSPSPTPTPTPTPTSTPSITPSPTRSPSPIPTSSPSATPTPSATPVPSPTTTPSPITTTFVFNVRFEGIHKLRADKIVNVSVKQGGTIIIDNQPVIFTGNTQGLYTSSQITTTLISIAGSYDFYFKGPLHLTEKFTQAVNAGQINNYDFSYVDLLTGDIVDNDCIDVYDYNRVVSDFGPRMPAGGSRADVDFDGDVDIYDYNYVVGNYQTCGVTRASPIPSPL